MMRTARMLAAAVLFTGVMAVAPPPAGAESITVTSTADIVDGGDGLTSLREAITTANANAQADTIVLSSATYTLSLCLDGELLYDEAEDLTIEGNGATIVQTCTDQRILDKAGSNTTVLTISDLTVENSVNSGANIDGAAFRAQSQLILDNVMIDGINAGFSGSLVAVDFGTAVNDLELHDVTITNNVGRGVDNLNPAGILVTGSTISDNSASGISLGDGTPLTVEDSMIIGNGGHGISTSGQGNGIQPVVTITNTTIADNDFGGFLCLTSCRTLDVAGSAITGNGAAAPAGRGGGLVMAVFTDNFPPLQSVTITDTLIQGNQADHDGGGLLVGASFEIDGPDSPTTVIAGSTITDNHATCSACDGGGVAVQVGDLAITNSLVDANTAGHDGGGVSQRRVSYDEITAPTAFDMSGTTVTGNSAGHNGGGLWIHSSTQLIDASVISGNYSSNFAGGMELGGSFTTALFESGVGTVTASTLAGNTAAFGGAVALGFPDGSSASLTNVTVTANEATTAGGGFAVGPTELLDLHHATIVGNVSPVGANLASSGPTNISASVVAGASGGGLDCEPFPFGPFPLNVTSLGFNWFDGNSCPSAVDDIVDLGGDPQLGVLGDNGGPTPTLLPSATSPLVALVPPASCTVAVDQRNEPRPAGAGCEPGSVEVDGGGAPIMGTNRSDVLVGTNGPDIILGLGGSDSLFGLAGDDRLEGGNGRDLLFGGTGTNMLLGGNGRDILHAQGIADVLEGGNGSDLLIDWVGGNTLLGGRGADVLVSFATGTVFDGGPGRDLCIEPGRRFRC